VDLVPSISPARSEEPKDEKQFAALEGYGGAVFALVLGARFACRAGADCADFAQQVSDRKPRRLFRGHAARILSLDFHEATGRLDSGAQDGEVRVWNAARGAAQAVVLAAP
jgi:hypothetical protein